MRVKLAILFSVLIMTGGIFPVFAEVTQFQLGENIYQRGDFVEVTGKVTEESSGLVTIVLRDPNNEFILLNQAIIRADNTFEKTILLNEEFDLLGVHNVTAFVTNVTAAKIQSFELVSEKPEQNSAIKETPPPIQETKILLETTSDINEVSLESDIPDFEETVKENTEEPRETIPIKEDSIADFVDTTKDPQYYLDRYNNEPKYKSWFDRNYPDMTIEEAIGYVPTTIEKQESKEFVNEILPPAEAASIQVPQKNNDDNKEFGQIGLALGGLAILFGAVYGIKRKVGDNPKGIPINKRTIRKKILSSIIQPKPRDIIQRRLAIGEITMAEYEQLCQKLDDGVR